MKRKILLIIALLGFIFVSADYAMAYTADGDLGEWGVNPSTSDWVPNPGVFYTEEDYVGLGGFVNPGWGGQQFDAEALYVYADSTNLYLALVTGFPNTGVDIGSTHYSAGEIALDFGANGTWDYGVEIGGHNPSGYGGYGGVPGHVYKGITWQPDTSWGGVSSPLYMLSAATDAGTAGFAYNNTNYGNDHWVVELSIPKTVFGSDWNEYGTVHWTQSCGNDNINVTTVPEPMSMALLGAGLFGLLGARLRKRMKE